MKRYTGLATVVLIGGLLAWVALVATGKTGYRTAPPPSDVTASESSQAGLTPSAIERRDEAEAESSEREPVDVPKRVERDSDAASLTVRLYWADLKTPIANVPIYVVPPGNGGGQRLAGFRPRQTDEDGEAAFDLPAGSVRDVVVQFFRLQPDARIRPVSSLGPGEARILEVPIAPPVHWSFVRTLDRVSEEPVSGVLVRQDDPPEDAPETEAATVLTDAEGLALVRWDARLGSTATASSPTHVPVRFTLSDRHAEPEAAIELYLLRPASVSGSVSGADGGPVVGARVDLSGMDATWYSPAFLHARGQKTWSCETDARGAFEFDLLPPQTELKVRLLVGGAEVNPFLEPLFLAPGEQRELRLRVGNGATITGVATAGGTVVPDLDLLLVRGADPQGPRYLSVSSFDDSPVAQARTDASGRFAFQNVPIGTWLIGPSPPEPNEETTTAPLAVPLVISSLTAREAVNIEIQQGLFVRGRVLDPAGQPARVLIVGDGKSLGWRSAQSDENGYFQLGPLAPGLIHVQAYGASDFGASEIVTAQAGDQGVQLYLCRGGAIFGTVVEETTGLPIPATVLFSPVGSDREYVTTSTMSGGAYRFGGLRPGGYSLSATTKSGLVGTATCDVRIGEEVQASLRVEPGASVSVFPVQGSGSFTVHQNGQLFALGWFLGQPATVTVPVGSVLVTLRGRGDHQRIAERRLDVTAGERIDVRF
jgi:hypothetical protein